MRGGFADTTTPCKIDEILRKLSVWNIMREDPSERRADIRLCGGNVWIGGSNSGPTAGERFKGISQWFGGTLKSWQDKVVGVRQEKKNMEQLAQTWMDLLVILPSWSLTWTYVSRNQWQLNPESTPWGAFSSPQGWNFSSHS